MRNSTAISSSFTNSNVNSLHRLMCSVIFSTYHSIYKFCRIVTSEFSDAKLHDSYQLLSTQSKLFWQVNKQIIIFSVDKTVSILLQVIFLGLFFFFFFFLYFFYGISARFIPPAIFGYTKFYIHYMHTVTKLFYRNMGRKWAEKIHGKHHIWPVLHSFETLLVSYIVGRI